MTIRPFGAGGRRYAAPLVIALLVANSALAGTPASPGPAPSRLEGLAWLAGSWVRDSAGVRVEEHWMAPAGGLMLGMSRETSAGTLRAFEFLRIRERGDTIVYLASPGGRPPTGFTLTAMSEGRAVFENPAHDFPQRIVYSLERGGALRARIEGTIDGRVTAEEWVWRRGALAP